MAGTTKAAEKAVQEPTEAKAEAKVYNLRSSNKYLTVSSLGVQFMAGKYTTTDPVVPHEGTWIEISTQRDSWRLKGSFPTWERELK